MKNSINSPELGSTRLRNLPVVETPHLSKDEDTAGDAEGRQVGNYRGVDRE